MNKTQCNRIIKIDRVEYLHSKKLRMQGHLWLTSTHVILEAKKKRFSVIHRLLHIFRIKALRKVYRYEIRLGEISEVKITHKNNDTLSIIFQKDKCLTVITYGDCNEWRNILTSII